MGWLIDLIARVWRCADLLPCRLYRPWARHNRPARGMSQLAGETGVSRAALYRSLSKNGNPSLDTILKVTRALGLELHVSAAAEPALA